MAMMSEVGDRGTRDRAGVISAAALHGAVQHHWPPLLLSPLAIAYGFLWLRVARTGRRLQWPIRRVKAPPSRRD